MFSEDDVEVESVLLPLAMFEDLIRDITKLMFTGALLEEVKNGKYQTQPNDGLSKKIGAWLYCNSLFSLLKTNK